jgi:hypothetical protein
VSPPSTINPGFRRRSEVGPDRVSRSRRTSGDELSVPPEQRIRGNNRREPAKLSSSEQLRRSREPAPLRIREAKPLSPELFPESFVLGF